MGKIGRNDPCPCGSGKKYKKCCATGGAKKPATPTAALKEANRNAHLTAQKWMSAMGAQIPQAADKADEFKLVLDEYKITDANSLARVRAQGKKGEDELSVLFYEGKQWVGEADLSVAGKMVVTTADTEQADRLKAKLVNIAGVVHASRKEDVFEAMDKQQSASVGAEMLDFKKTFFKAWPDEPNERLGGLTPRQASQDPVSRKQVSALIKDLEKAEAKLPKGQRYSFSTIRKLLNL